MTPEQWIQYQQWLQSQGMSAGAASSPVGTPLPFNPVQPQTFPSNLPGVPPTTGLSLPPSPVAPPPGLPANINAQPLPQTGSELPPGLTQGLGPLGSLGGLLTGIPALGPIGASAGAILGLLGGLGVFDSGLPKTAKTSAVASGLQQAGNPLQALVGQYMAGGAGAGNPLSNPAFGSSVEQVSSMLEALTNQQVPPITLTGAFDNPVHWQASPVANVEKLLQLPKGVSPIDPATNPGGLQTAYADISKTIPYSGPLGGPQYAKDFQNIVQQLMKQGVLKGPAPAGPTSPSTLGVAQGAAASGNLLDQVIAQYLGGAAQGNPNFTGKLPGTANDIATILQNLTGQSAGSFSIPGANGQPQNLQLGAAPGGSGFALPPGFNFLGTDANSLQAALQAIQKNIPANTGQIGGSALSQDWQKIVQQLMSSGVLTKPGQQGTTSATGQGQFPTQGAFAGQAAPGSPTTTQGLAHPLTQQPNIPLPYPIQSNSLYPLAY